jgi:SNARE associated Golgi protein
VPLVERDVPALLAAVAIAGAIAGDSIGYAFGRLGAEPLGRSWLGRRIGQPRLQAAEAYLRRRGGLAVFTGRFVGFLRALVPFFAGVGACPMRASWSGTSPEYIRAMSEIPMTAGASPLREVQCQRPGNDRSWFQTEMPNSDPRHDAIASKHLLLIRRASSDASCVPRPIAIRSNPGEGLDGTAGSHVLLAS